MRWLAIFSLILIFLGCMDGTWRRSAYTKMTPRENSLLETWDQCEFVGNSDFMPFTTAAVARKAKPDNGMFPFCDMPEAVKAFGENQCGSKKFKEKFPDFFTQYDEFCALNKTGDFQYNYKYEGTVGEPIDSPKVEEEEIKKLSYNDLKVLREESKTCKPAQNLLGERYSEKNYLTDQDGQDVMGRILACNNAELAADSMLEKSN